MKKWLAWFINKIKYYDLLIIYQSAKLQIVHNVWSKISRVCEGPFADINIFIGVIETENANANASDASDTADEKTDISWPCSCW